jgi:hypothetical protein
MNETYMEREHRRQEALATRIPVKLGVLIDPTTGHIYEMEIDDIIEEFEDHLAPSHRPRLTQSFGGPEDLSDSHEMDVLVVDYGGLHGGYGDAVHRYGTSVAKWAEEHPGRLVVLWTPFTSTLYRSTFEAEFGSGREQHLYDDYDGEYETCWRCHKTQDQHVPTDTQNGNILYRYGVGRYAFDNEKNADFWQKVRGWVGVKDVDTSGSEA